METWKTDEPPNYPLILLILKVKISNDEGIDELIYSIHDIQLMMLSVESVTSVTYISLHIIKTEKC